MRISAEQAANFSDLWGHYDVRGTHFLDARSVSLIIAEMDYPLGLAHDPRLLHLQRDLVQVGGGGGAAVAAVAAAVSAMGEIRSSGSSSSSGGGGGGGAGPTPQQPPTAAKKFFLKRGKGFLVGSFLARRRRLEALGRLTAAMQDLSSRVFEDLRLASSSGGLYHYHAVLQALLFRAARGSPVHHREAAAAAFQTAGSSGGGAGSSAAAAAATASTGAGFAPPHLMFLGPDGGPVKEIMAGPPIAFKRAAGRITRAIKIFLERKKNVAVRLVRVVGVEGVKGAPLAPALTPAPAPAPAPALAHAPAAPAPVPSAASASVSSGGNSLPGMVGGHTANSTSKGEEEEEEEEEEESLHF